MNRKLIINIMFIIAGLIFFSNIQGLNIFKLHPIYWLFLIGVTLIVITLFCLPFSSLTESIATANAGVSIIGIVFFVGLIYTHIYGYPPPGYPPLAPSEMAKKCDSAEWIITIKYRDRGDYAQVIHGSEHKFIGTTEQSEDYLPKIINYWKEQHPKLEMVSVDKVLIHIPKEYAREHEYDKETSNWPPPPKKIAPSIY